MSKLKIRIGAIEVDLDSENLAADVEIAQKLVAAIISHAPQAATQQSPIVSPVTGAGAGENPIPIPSIGPGAGGGEHMNTYVAKLGADTCRKMMQAASVHLAIADGLETFSKDQLFERAREAKEWKSDYSNQQASNISRMVKSGELIQKNSGLYCVPDKIIASARQELSK